MNNQQFQEFGDLEITERSAQLLLELDAYVALNFDQLIADFVDCLTTYCQKIVKMQATGEKKAISFLNFSLLQTNLLRQKYELRIDAYDETWYLDRVACVGSYEVGKFYQGLTTFWQELVATHKKYLGKLKYSQLQSLFFEESYKYLIFVQELMRVAIKKAVESNIYQQVKRNDVFVICLGGYQDGVDVVYKEDRTIKNAKAVRRHLTAKNGQEARFSYEFCDHLDLSAGNFTRVSTAFSSFTGCDFTDASFEASAHVMTNFELATFKNTNFKNTKLFDLNFSGATLENLDFTGSRLKHLNFQGATLKNVNFEQALLISQLDFTGATLINTQIPKERSGH